MIQKKIQNYVLIFASQELMKKNMRCFIRSITIDKENYVWRYQKMGFTGKR